MSEDKKGHKLFVGGLNVESTTNESMKEYFCQFGETEDCKVMRDAEKSRGFGFVTFVEKSSFDDCLAKKDHVIDGKTVEVKVAVPRNQLGAGGSSAPRRHRVKKVFLGGLSPETTKDQITEALELVCCEGCVADVSIMTEKGTEKPRGFGFAILKDPRYCPEDREYEEAAYDIVDKLVREKKFIKVGDRDVEVKPAKSLEDMRKDEESKASRSFSNYSGSGYGYGSTRDMMYPSRNMYDNMRMSSGYYPGSSFDYLQSRSSRDYPISQYSSMSYDRSGASAYGYDTSGGGAAIDYSKYYYGGMMGSYPQSASSYGPAARGYGDYKERSDRGDSRASYHPYSRR